MKDEIVCIPKKSVMFVSFFFIYIMASTSKMENTYLAWSFGNFRVKIDFFLISNWFYFRGDKDVYKFTLQPTEITLHDPTVPGETKLNFIEKGLTYTKFPTKVKDIGSALYDPETNSGLDSIQKELYEKELEEILKNNVDNVEEVIVFDHVIRSSKVAGKEGPEGY